MSGRSDATLILAAHGGGEGSSANRALEALATRLGHGASVAFQLGAPSFDDIPDAPDSVVLPLLAAEGYYTRRRLPSAAIERSIDREPAGGLPIAPALGTSAELLDRLVERVADAGDDPLAPVVVAAHGTRRDARSAATAEALCRRLRDARPGAFVEVGFLDQEPRLSDVLALSRGESGAPIVVPWMWGGGGHARQDLPNALAEAGVRHAVVLPPLAELDELAEATRRAGRQARERLPLRVGARDSTLAVAQTRLAQERLAGVGCPTTLSTLAERGDADLDRSIAELGPGAFSDALEGRLSSGRIDVAVHSLKDLPLDRFGPSSNGPLHVAAILPRGAAGEVLVSRRGTPLDDLPLGARVGTCSTRRSRQLLLRRPDLEIAPLRGPVDSRIEQVLDGRYEAAVLAEAGVARLGLERVIAERLPLDDFLPDPGQGALAIQVRADDALARTLVERVDHAPTRRAVLAERLFQSLSPRGVVAAGIATAAPHGAVDLRARWLTGRRAIDVHAREASAAEAASKAIELCLRAISEPVMIGAHS